MVFVTFTKGIEGCVEPVYAAEWNAKRGIRVPWPKFTGFATVCKCTEDDSSNMVKICQSIYVKICQNYIPSTTSRLEWVHSEVLRTKGLTWHMDHIRPSTLEPY